jgi:hypothetical protein
MSSHPLIVVAITAGFASALVSASGHEAGRSEDCASPTQTTAFLRLSVPEAREILGRQFSQNHPGQAPLAFGGLDYACVTRFRAKDQREVGVFGRGGDVRLFVTGAPEAELLQDAINRLIHEARQTGPHGAAPEEDVHVRGAVESPGNVPYHAGMTVADALQVIGATNLGKRARLKLRHTGGGRTEPDRVGIEAKLTDHLEPGDTIDVSIR